MRFHTIFSLIVSLVSASSWSAFGQTQVDPVLTSAVIVQTESLKSTYKERERTQKKILGSEITVGLSLERVHSVEEQMLEYLTNIQGAMTNLYQIKRATELVGVEIPKNIAFLTESIPHHLKGTAIAAVVSNEIADATAQMTTLIPFMKQLVVSGSYTTQGYDENGNPVDKKHKVNLLNSAERYYIANEVVSKLESVNSSLFILAWQVNTLGWNNLWYKLDPEGWANIMSGKNAAETLVWQWKNLK